MAGDFTLKKKLLKQLRRREGDSAKSKTQDGSPTYVPVSANPSQDHSSNSHSNTDPQTTTIYPTPPKTTDVSASFPTATPTALSDIRAKGDQQAHSAEAVTDQAKIIRDHSKLAQETKQLILDREDQACLRDLQVSDPRLDKVRIEAIKGGLLKESYSWILDHPKFRQWRDEQNQMLWIKGGPGMGKTMLLCGLINEVEPSTRLSDQNADPLLSYFFCQATDVRFNNGIAALRNLMYLLIVQRPSLIWRVREKYDSIGRALFENSGVWDGSLATIFLNILQDLSGTTTYLVIDALDECTHSDEFITLILGCVSDYSHIKWIVSSRETHTINKYMRSNGFKTGLSIELNNTASIYDAINTYIDKRVSELEFEDDDNRLRQSIPYVLRRRTDGTFLWVSLVIQQLQEAQCDDEVMEALSTIPTDLNEIYARMMEQIHKQYERKYCLLVLTAATLAYRPLHLLELAVVSGLSPINMGRVGEFVSMCGSFLTLREDHVYMIHVSAKNYLYQNYSSLQLSGVAQRHVDIIRHSFSAIAKLEKNIYSIDFGFRPEYPDSQPVHPDPLTPVRYSCIFWADHLCRNSNDPECKEALTDDGVVLRFLKTQFLRWLECLSLTRSLPTAIKSIKDLLQISHQIDSHELTTFLRDAEKFILSYGSIIERAPLQVYGAALVFCPKTSIIQNEQWRERLSFIKTVVGVRDRWGTLRQTLEGHTGYVNAVAVSPSGNMIASASNDCTIRLWDATLGTFRQKLEGHSDWVRAIAFSLDGEILASASNDHTIQLWRAPTGAFLHKFEGHSEWVRAVVFSPKGYTIASASNDRTIRLWGAATGMFRYEGHSGWVYAVAFSPDGLTLASASSDHTVRLWDIGRGVLQQTLRGHRGSTRTVSFSPDGKTLASASDDRTIRLWDVATGMLQQTCEGHSDWVRAVTFSPDGRTLASASNDGTVQLWDTATGTPRGILEGHSDYVNAVAFFPDSQTLVSASDDCTVRLWDTSISSQETLKGPDDNINVVAFSSDGKTLASVSDDCIVQLWDTATHHQTSRQHSSRVRAIAFSPNNKILALASEDCMVWFWDITTDTFKQALKGHDNYINALSFSPDGKMLASASNDSTVRLWDTATYILQKTFKGHAEAVGAIAFSPNGKMLASASVGYTVRLWDITTGTLQKTLQVQSSSAWVSAIAFSPNSKILALASDNYTVRLLDAATGALQQTLETDQILTELAFSNDGQYLKTDYGFLKLAENTFPDESPSQDISDYALFVGKEWVTLDGKNILWLPHEYRPTCVAVYGQSVVIGRRPGGLMFLHFDLESLD
ncbi:WD40-repeat-containing domain protein [Trichoderma sp. SZMC 28012]